MCDVIDVCVSLRLDMTRTRPGLTVYSTDSHTAQSPTDMTTTITTTRLLCRATSRFFILYTVTPTLAPLPEFILYTVTLQSTTQPYPHTTNPHPLHA